jgi:hypothetical protein
MALAHSRANEGSRDRPDGQGSAMPMLCAAPGLQLFSGLLHMPFDVMRTQHAQAVHAGIMANSILESRDFENSVDALEHIWLGPFARHV